MQADWFVFCMRICIHVHMYAYKRQVPFILVASQVRQWLPDLPEDYFHLPGPEEKLDFLRPVPEVAEYQ